MQLGGEWGFGTIAGERIVSKRDRLQTLPQVVLGATELRVSAVGLGCSRLGSVLSGGTTEMGIELVQHALRLGVTLFTTADIYGQGASERILGTALRKNRNSVTLVTKGGQRFTSAQQIASLAKRPVRFLVKQIPAFRDMVAANRANRLPRNYTATYLHRALEQSLRRLQTDYIDLYLLHSPAGTEIEKSDSFAMLERAKEKGLIRHWGISCDDLPTVEAALRVNGISALEVPRSALYPVARSAPPVAADLSARRIGLIVGQILASRHEAVAAASTPTGHIDLVRAHPNAASVIDTTNRLHLDEAII
jgi:aryl-alcohol dehydrogenase-like predicted oxidoreductase